jgi:3-phytase
MTGTRYQVALASLCLLTACTTAPAFEEPSDGAPLASAAVSAAAHSANPAPVSVEVPARYETEPVPDGRDAADDIAIWVDPVNATMSLVIGTNKKGSRGLMVYDLAGREVQAIDVGALNNVDLRPGAGPRAATASTIVAATAVEGRSLMLFRVDEGARRLEDDPFAIVDTGIRSAGICLYQADGNTFGFLTGGDGRVQQWHLIDRVGNVTGELVRELALESRTEGCAVDDVAHHLFVAEEATGIWRFDARPGSATEGELVETVADGRLTPDVEGIAIARHNEASFLLASSQGNDRIVTYRLLDGRLSFAGDITVVAGDTTDPVTHTDGVDVSTASFGSGSFFKGILVVQDDRNETAGKRANQNFKYVAWDDVVRALGID